MKSLSLKIKPTVTAGNEGIVHHLLAYLCNNKIDDRFPNKDFECSFDRENPLRDMVMSNCTTILGVFAVGSGVSDRQYKSFGLLLHSVYPSSLKI
jgi:Copper type II ascorbate-dependent monooxygenase, N-terminal domain